MPSVAVFLLEVAPAGWLGSRHEGLGMKKMSWRPSSLVPTPTLFYKSPLSSWLSYLPSACILNSDIETSALAQHSQINIHRHQPTTITLHLQNGLWNHA